MTIDALPAAPSRSDPTNFSARGDALMTALPNMVTQINASNAQASADAATASAQAASANASATSATASASAASGSAATALAAPGTNATSTTSLTVGSGSISLTLAQTGKSFAVGAWVNVTHAADVSKSMLGQISAFTSGTGAMTISVAAANVQGSGSGPYTDWSITQGSAPGSISNALDLTTIGPSIRPALLCDFANSKWLDPRFAYTMTSALSYYDSLGIIRYAAAGQIVFDHDPTTGKCLGIPFWEQRTNLAQYSEQLDNAYWTKTSCSVTANGATAPDGAVTMDKLIEASDVNQVHFISSTGFTVSAGTNYASHVFVKAGERTKGRLVYNTTGGYFVDFDVAAGTVGVETAFSGGSVVAGSAKITALPGGIYKISAVGYGASGTSAVIKVEMQDGSGNRQYNGDGTSGIYLWGMDCQLGSVDGPYIPTTSAQVTRAAPSLSIALSGFAFNSTEGSVYVEADGNPSATSGAMMFEIGDGTSGNRMLAYFNAGSGAAQWVVVAGSVNQAVLSVGAATIGAQSRMMASFKANNIVASVNGGSVVTDTSATVPSVTNLYLGYSPSSATTYLNGHLSKVALFPRQLSNNEHISASTQ